YSDVSLGRRTVSTLVRQPRNSIVVHLGKKGAATCGRHVEETPERVDEIAGAMVLLWSGRRKAHLRAPEVPDGAAFLPEDVKDCLVPILAVWNSMLRAHPLREFGSITKIVRIVGVARGRQQRKLFPAALMRPSGETRDRRFCDDVQRGALAYMPRCAIE